MNFATRSHDQRKRFHWEKSFIKNLNEQFTRKSHAFQVDNSLKNTTIILPKFCILFICTRLGSFNSFKRGFFLDYFRSFFKKYP